MLPRRSPRDRQVVACHYAPGRPKSITNAAGRVPRHRACCGPKTEHSLFRYKLRRAPVCLGSVRTPDIHGSGFSAEGGHYSAEPRPPCGRGAAAAIQLHRATGKYPPPQPRGFSPPDRCQEGGRVLYRPGEPQWTWKYIKGRSPRISPFSTIDAYNRVGLPPGLQ